MCELRSTIYKGIMIACLDKEYHTYKDYPILGEPFVDNSQGFINCDDEEDCAAGSGSGSGPPTSVVDDIGEDTPVYEPSPAGNEESEDLSQIGTEGSKCMQNNE